MDIEGFPQPGSPAPLRFGRIRAVANAASGSVGPGAGARLQQIAATASGDVEVAVVQPSEIQAALAAAVAAAPDLLIVLAGDGTAALSATLCGPDGPLLALLPGGTMNMLPHALYGVRAWPEALEAALTGVELRVSGGEVAGRMFYVAAILGEPALWAEAREALRQRRWRLAVLRAQRALRRTFSGRLRFSLNGGARRKAEALTLMCPLVSRALNADVGLEAAALSPRDALEAARLGVATLTGRWRDDPSVATELCTMGRAWAHGRIPAILDGEPHRLNSPVSLQFRPQAFRALAAADCAARAMFAPVEARAS